ncbi:hypothetical protein MOQ_009657 [Trypanosoma cruzi marinkellei]|uniref:Uncharacterized protein n=1 Tax=Trypanosoma cruzi marinkellei TaxID=85056 RepID=K2MHR0_TRYCR|nr:hypothetical protein MOQ_009657 [Trypanosoma cruzi marinkellei]
MKSVASHFLDTPYTEEGTVGTRQNGTTMGDRSDDVVRSVHPPPLFSSVLTPRPVLIGPLLRSPRISETVVLLDGVPCGAVCFSGRVVRCEGPQRHGGVSALRAYTALLISDNTGLISVMQPHTERVNVDVGAAWEGGDTSCLIGGVAELVGNATDEMVYENDYVFVVGWLAFADTSKEVRRLLQGVVDFVTGGDGTKPDENCFCVRGTVRLIHDMNELHFWALAALETNVRLLDKAGDFASAFPTRRKNV